MASVGGSIGWAGSGVSTSGAQMVLETVAFGSPAMATMSPASASSTAGALEPAKGQQLGDAALLDQLAFAVEHLDVLVGLHGAGGDAAGDDAAEIGIGFQDGAEHAERAGLDMRRLDVAQHQIEQRRHRILRPVLARRHPAFLGRTVENRKVELLVAGIECGEKVEHLVHHLRRARVGAVDLVDDDDGLQSHLQRLRHHEFGLRQRALGGVHQHDGAVNHIEDALDLAAKIGMAGRVDDIDAGVFPDHRGRLGQNGDTAFALEIVGIHGALDHALVLAERARLLQQPVDQGGLAVVDVGDDGDVAEIHDVPENQSAGLFGPATRRYCGAI